MQFSTVIKGGEVAGVRLFTRTGTGDEEKGETYSLDQIDRLLLRPTGIRLGVVWLRKCLQEESELVLTPSDGHPNPYKLRLGC